MRDPSPSHETQSPAGSEIPDRGRRRRTANEEQGAPRSRSDPLGEGGSDRDGDAAPPVPLGDEHLRSDAPRDERHDVRRAPARQVDSVERDVHDDPGEAPPDMRLGASASVADGVEVAPGVGPGPAEQWHERDRPGVYDVRSGPEPAGEGDRCIQDLGVDRHVLGSPAADHRQDGRIPPPAAVLRRDEPRGAAKCAQQRTVWRTQYACQAAFGHRDVLHDEIAPPA
jgi:hypothetical protein